MLVLLTSARPPGPPTARRCATVGATSDELNRHRLATMSVIDKLAYANEYECNETFTEDGEELNMRYWKHVWCAEKNNGELASLPTILGSLPATVPNLLKVACE